jgi:uncharacterized membrane protein
MAWLIAFAISFILVTFLWTNEVRIGRDSILKSKSTSQTRKSQPLSTTSIEVSMQ